MIPYHTHTFTLSTATKSDVSAGVSDTLVVVPTSLGSAATVDITYFATSVQGARADTAVQPDQLGALAKKDKVAVDDIDAQGDKTDTSFLNAKGKWLNIAAGGDMLREVYDPTGKSSDAFSMGNMEETDDRKILTSAEREKIANIPDGVPVGTTIFFDGVTAPKGYLVRDGSIVNISDFPALFKVLGKRYGGDGVKTFGVGDFRGYFLRGHNPNDSSRALGTAQGDAIRNIYGGFTTGGDHGGAFISQPYGGFSGGGKTDWRATTVEVPAVNWAYEWAYFNAEQQGITPVSTEVRPVNINLLICIKY